MNIPLYNSTDSYIGDIGVSGLVSEDGRIMGVVHHEDLNPGSTRLETRETVLLVVNGASQGVMSTGDAHQVWYGSDANFGWIYLEEGGYARTKQVMPQLNANNLEEVLRTAADRLGLHNPPRQVPTELAYRRRTIDWVEITESEMRNRAESLGQGWRVKYNAPGGQDNDSGLVGFWIKRKGPGQAECLGWIARGPTGAPMDTEDWSAYEYGNDPFGVRAKKWMDRVDNSAQNAPHGIIYLRGTCEAEDTTWVTSA